MRCSKQILNESDLSRYHSRDFNLLQQTLRIEKMLVKDVEKSNLHKRRKKRNFSGIAGKNECGRSWSEVVK